MIDIVSLPDEPVRLVIDFVSGDTKTRVDFGIKHPDEHKRDALPILAEMLTSGDRPVGLLLAEPPPMICGAGMGGGVICDRTLEVVHDPFGWRCGWGHRWWFRERVDGMFRYRADVPLGTLISDTQHIPIDEP